MAEQNYKNHVRLVAGYHFVLMPILLLNLAWAVRHLWFVRTYGSVVTLLVAVALILLAFFARSFALKVQDRVIRLEMRLRLAGVLPADLAGRAGELSADQLVALRFASDAELAGLTRKILEDGIQGRKAIKLLVQNWQADEFRA